MALSPVTWESIFAATALVTGIGITAAGAADAAAKPAGSCNVGTVYYNGGSSHWTMPCGVDSTVFLEDVTQIDMYSGDVAWIELNFRPAVFISGVTYVGGNQTLTWTDGSF